MFKEKETHSWRFSEKLLTKIEEALEEDGTDSRKLQELAIDLKEKRDKLKQLDENILERMYDADKIDKACDEEAGGASDIMEKIVYQLVCLENAIEDSSSTKGSNSIERSVSQESLQSKGSRLSNI